MEQHVGHRTYYQNLRQVLDNVPQLDAEWVPVDYVTRSGLWRRLPLPHSQVVGSLIGRDQVRRGLRATQPDVAFFYTQVLGSLAGGLAYQQPYILCTDITPKQYDQMAEHYNHTPDGKGLLARYKHRVNVRLMQRAARIIPWSNWVADSLIKDYGVRPDRIEVIPPGVDTSLWQPGSAPEHASRERPRILFVGGDFWRKGGDRLLDVFRQLPTDTAELHLVTRSAVQSEPGVRVYRDLQANSPELVQLFRTSDLFVLPTQAEAFGLVSIEAAATGLPVIGTRVGGQPDIVSEGETGFLIEPNDNHALGQRLSQLLLDADLRRRMGQAARRRAERCFDAKTNAHRVYKLIEEVAVDAGQPQPFASAISKEIVTH